MKPQDDISINPGATYPNLNNLDGSPDQMGSEKSETGLTV